MCQLYAMNSSQSVSIEAALRTFTARGGRTGDHIDGWGVVFHEDCGSRIFIEPERAVDSALASFLCLSPIRASTVLAHVRKATHGQPALVNCHPFQREWRGRLWSFCHNGKLIDHAPALTGPYQPVGETDSEHAFCWIMERLRALLPGQAAPGWQDVAPLLAELATQVGRHGEFNFTLTDGTALYALGATRLAWQLRQPVSHTAHEPLRLVQLATEPLDASPGWQSFAAGELKVFVQGEPVWSRRLDLAPITSAPLQALAA
jgi:glutamine amidotransferase